MKSIKYVAIASIFAGTLNVQAMDQDSQLSGKKRTQYQDKDADRKKLEEQYDSDLLFSELLLPHQCLMAQRKTELIEHVQTAYDLDMTMLRSSFSNTDTNDTLYPRERFYRMGQTPYSLPLPPKNIPNTSCGSPTVRPGFEVFAKAADSRFDKIKCLPAWKGEIVKGNRAIEIAETPNFRGRLADIILIHAAIHVSLTDTITPGDIMAEFIRRYKEYCDEIRSDYDYQTKTYGPPSSEVVEKELADTKNANLNNCTSESITGLIRSRLSPFNPSDDTVNQIRTALIKQSLANYIENNIEPLSAKLHRASQGYL
jgi:hypothetical protein